MRNFAIAMLVFSVFCSIGIAAQAQQSSSCKQCADQRQACMSNYSEKTCKTEYDICMKSCQRK